MEYLLSLVPKFEHLGLLIYWIVLIVSSLESTAFIGLVIPGTTILIFAGFLAAQGIVDFGDLIWFAAAGGFIGDGVSFFLGRHGINLENLERRFFKHHYLERGKKFFLRYGGLSVILARFVGPLRPIVPLVAGLFKMNPRLFFLCNILGGIAAAAAYLALGFFFGAAWGKVSIWLEHGKAGMLVILGALLTGYALKKLLFRPLKTSL